MRSWVAYSLYPGSSYNPEITTLTGDIKIMLTVEYRFNILGGLNGALFSDAGNIWLSAPEESLPGGEFKFNRFYKEFAVGVGAGIRYDFDFFLIRLDAGVKVRQPELQEGNRWTFENLNFANAVWNFGIGYPF
jgi:outer membrane protein assembly factor BamA